MSRLRRLALQIALDLPRDKREAMAVIELAKDIVKWAGVDEISQPVRLVRPEGDETGRIGDKPSFSSPASDRTLSS